MCTNYQVQSDCYLGTITRYNQHITNIVNQCSIILEKTNDQDPFKQGSDTGLESKYILAVRLKQSAAGFANWKQIASCDPMDQY